MKNIFSQHLLIFVDVNQNVDEHLLMLIHSALTNVNIKL